MFFGLTFICSAVAQQDGSALLDNDERAPKPAAPKISPASDDAKLAMSSFQYRPELKVALFAAEPLVANPVAIHVDAACRVFVCETFRQEFGVEDNREHPEWMDEELAAQTVQDRVDYIRKHEPDIKKEYNDQDDRIRLLVDNDNDGVADDVTVFSDRYNAIEDGTGAGVLAIGDDVFYTNIPHLWRLRDTNNDGVADSRESLLSGFGVRFAFRGHDLHGLILGPDRRLYFSVGDRGYNVSPEIKDPSSGAVFSCELDGSDLQVYATGLRNPQELAFDDYGNLFTGDNNSDSGDKARWVYVVPGGDSGWRMYYQYLPDRGPFNREKIWHPYHKDTPAYTVPPIANLADGPSGLAYYPGTGFSDYFRDRFFLCDFRGTANVSGIRSFRLKPKGAGFEIIDSDKPIWNMLATDLDFGPDGRLYVADWVYGWQGVGKGRIYTYHDPQHIVSEEAIQAQKILKEGLNDTTIEELVELLGHADRRVRYASQFELVDRKELNLLGAAIFQPPDARHHLIKSLHAVWGYTILAKQGLDKAEMKQKDFQVMSRLAFLQILAKPEFVKDAELRAQAVRYFGELPIAEVAWAAKDISPILKDPSARVRFMAAIALGNIAGKAEIDSVTDMLADNQDADAYLRHAGIMGLSGIIGRITDSARAPIAALLLRNESPSVRLAAVVAFRKLKSEHVAAFLDDEDPQVVLEAARAIHDLPLGMNEMESLAQLIDRPLNDDALIRRVLNANLIVGEQENATLVSSFAADSTHPLPRRVDALEMLATWANPAERDYVLGDWRPKTEPRDQYIPTTALAAIQTTAINDKTIASKYIDACVATKLKLPIESLQTIVSNDKLDESIRIAALKALQITDSDSFKKRLVQLSSSSGQLPDKLANVVLEQLVDIDSKLAVTGLQYVIESNAQPIRKQTAIRLLSRCEPKNADSILLAALKRLANGNIEPEIQLDIILAAEKSDNQDINRLVETIRAQPPQFEDQDLAPYAYTLAGGDAENGKRLFFEQGDLSCLRCHLVDGSGGAVGPDLSGIGSQKSGEYLLQSIVNPNRTIAEGYNQSIVLTDEGLVLTGIKKDEDENLLTLMDQDGKLIRISKDSIDDIKIGKSSMPEDLVKKLSLIQLRDLIEYLANRKKGPSEPAEPDGH